MAHIWDACSPTAPVTAGLPRSPSTGVHGRQGQSTGRLDVTAHRRASSPVATVPARPLGPVHTGGTLITWANQPAALNSLQKEALGFTSAW